MKKWWRYLHGFIILNFLAEIGYGFYMVFFVVGGSRYPLWMRAVETPIEIILKRRLYAIEVWIAIAGLVLYVALTEVIPRKLSELQVSIEKKPE
jgi:hypothetical protein